MTLLDLYLQFLTTHQYRLFPRSDEYTDRAENISLIATVFHSAHIPLKIQELSLKGKAEGNPMTFQSSYSHPVIKMGNYYGDDTGLYTKEEMLDHLLKQYAFPTEYFKAQLSVKKVDPRNPTNHPYAPVFSDKDVKIEFAEEIEQLKTQYQSLTDQRQLQEETPVVSSSRKGLRL